MEFSTFELHKLSQGGFPEGKKQCSLCFPSQIFSPNFMIFYNRCDHSSRFITFYITHYFFLKIYLKKFLLLYFFHYHLVPLYHPPPAITPLLSMSMSPFYVLFNPSTPEPSAPCPPPLAVILLSMSLSLFCLLTPFINEIPHLSEIIWYFSISDWLISLSIMFFSSIHTVIKGKIFFFFMAE